MHTIPTRVEIDIRQTSDGAAEFYREVGVTIADIRRAQRALDRMASQPLQPSRVYMSEDLWQDILNWTPE